MPAEIEMKDLPARYQPPAGGVEPKGSHPDYTPVAARQVAGQDALPGHRMESDPAPAAPSGTTAAASRPATRGGPSTRTRAAASATRTAWRLSGSGRMKTSGAPSVRGIIWVFVWLGVFLYLLSNPATLPRTVHIVLSPIAGIVAVAHGGQHVAAKVA